jgi:hypothetical protein
MVAMVNQDDLHDLLNSPKFALDLQRGPITNEFVNIESATSSVENLYKEGVLDPVYYAKTMVLNRALQEIGMGKYQVLMVVLHSSLH